MSVITDEVTLQHTTSRGYVEIGRPIYIDLTAADALPNLRRDHDGHANWAVHPTISVMSLHLQESMHKQAATGSTVMQ